MIERSYHIVTYGDVCFFYPTREALNALIVQDAAPRQNGRISRVFVTRFNGG